MSCSMLTILTTRYAPSIGILFPLSWVFFLYWSQGILWTEWQRELCQCIYGPPCILEHGDGTPGPCRGIRESRRTQNSYCLTFDPGTMIQQYLVASKWLWVRGDPFKTLKRDNFQVTAGQKRFIWDIEGRNAVMLE